MENTDKTTAAAELDAAAAEAVNEDLKMEEEPKEEPLEEPKEEEPEFDEDGLPLNHAARSELGRKVAAYHRRMDMLEEKLGKLDEFDSKINTLLQYFNKPEEEIDPDMPMTFRDFMKIQEKTSREQAQLAEAYNKSYISTITALSKDMDDDYYKAVIDEMKNISYTPSNDPKKDAELNFAKAENRLLKKKVVTKKNPLQGKSPSGTLTKQPTPKNEKPLPKLDAAAQDYLAYIRYRDGDEAAEKAKKELS